MSDHCNTMSQAQRDMADCTAAFCGRCKRVRLVSVTSAIDAKAKREFGQLAAEGCDIRHMTATEVRKQAFGCMCE